MPYIIKYQIGGEDKYSYDIITKEQLKSRLQEIGEGHMEVRHNPLSFDGFIKQQPNGFLLSENPMSTYFENSTPVPNAEIGLGDKIIPEPSHVTKKRSHWVLVILLALACLGGVIIAVSSKQKKKERLYCYHMMRALRDAGFDLRGEYTKKEIDEIVLAINNGEDGTITMQEFQTILSDGTRQKIIANGDTSEFPLLGVSSTYENYESATPHYSSSWSDCVSIQIVPRAAYGIGQDVIVTNICSHTISKVVVTVTADGRSKDTYYFDIAPGESDMSAITVAADAFLYVSDVQVFF